MSDTMLSLKKPSELDSIEREYFKHTLLESSNLIFKISYYLNKIEYLSDIDSIVAIFKEKDDIVGMIVFKYKTKFNKIEKKFNKFKIIEIDFLLSKKGFGSKNLNMFMNEFKSYSFLLYTEKDFKHLDNFYTKNGFQEFGKMFFPKRRYYFKNVNAL